MGLLQAGFRMREPPDRQYRQAESGAGREFIVKFLRQLAPFGQRDGRSRRS
jgi:hypothetical protein